MSLQIEPGVSSLSERLRDGGPLYTETDLNRLIAEPWNAASALLFLVLVVFWLARLRGQYRQHPFLTCCLPILAVGGVGGTVYHAFRLSPIFLVMDVAPIFVLGLAASVYLWLRLSPRWWQVGMVLGVYLLLQTLAYGLPAHQAINLGYASLAVLILTPLVFLLARTRFRQGAWVAAALGSFGLALFFRYADTWRPPLLPMGTHWLWHLFGAVTTAFLMEYLFRVSCPTPAAPALVASPR
jgi:hemolysin III